MIENRVRPYLRRFDWNLLLIGLLLLPALQPLFKPTLTQSSDGLAHLYRLVALDRVLEQGALFTRWLPDLVYGYGSPLFVYYPPLAYYLAEIPHALGLDAVYAFNLSMALALVVAAWGVYLFVREIFGAAAGIVAAVAYAYSPFQLLNVYARGSLPTAWGMAFLPLALWAFYRLARPGEPPDRPGQAGWARLARPGVIPAAVFLAAWLLSHNVTVLIFGPLLAGYLLLFLFLGRDRRKAAATGLALLLGAGLAAFFLLPALAEREFAQLWRLTTPPDFDFHYHFIPWTELLAWPPVVDTGLLNPVPPLTIGLVQLGLALLGLAGLIRLRGPAQRPVVALSALALGASIFMMLPDSVGVWERLPLIALVQRPSRLLGLPALLMAVLAGAALAAFGGPPVARTRRSLLLALGGVLVVAGGAVPLLYPRYDRVPSTDPDLLDMMAYEHASGTIGTTSFGEYLPQWVRQAPRESPLEELYRSGAPLDRLDRGYLPPGAGAETELAGLNRLAVRLRSPEATQAVFHTFFFPGWQATIDGRPAEVAPVSERGLIGVAVPAGESELVLRFAETPLRRAANLISLLAALAAAGLVAIRLGRAARPDTTPVAAPLPGGHALALAALGIGLLLFKSIYLDRVSNPLKRDFDGQHVAGAQVDVQANLGNAFTLLGYDWSGPAVAPGDTLDLTLYWQAQHSPARDYSSLVQLVDTARNIYGAQDNLHPGQYPTSRWPPWGYVADPHAVPVPAGTPPGDYFLVAGLYRPDTWQRLPVLTPGLDAWGDVVALSPVRVLRPNRPPAVEALGIAVPLEQPLAPGPTLLGFSPEPGPLPRGDFLRLALFWEAGSGPLPDVRVALRLLAADGSPVAERAARPSNDRYPAPAWQPGERVRDNHALWIPPDLPPGRYTLHLQLEGPGGEAVGEGVALGAYEAP